MKDLILRKMLTSLEPTKELGKLKYGKPTGFHFQLKNQGTHVVKIDKVVVGCGSCTVASVPKTNLEPGEEVDMSVTFTPGNTGHQTKHITVRYDEVQVLKLKFSANVEP